MTGLAHRSRTGRQTNPAARRFLRLPISTNFWQANLAGWLFIAALGVTARTIFFGDLKDALILTCIFESVGFGLTCLVHLLLRGRIHSPVPAAIIIPLALLACVAGGFLQMGVAHLLRAYVFTHGEFYNAYGGRYVTLVYCMTIFMGWALAYFWLTADHSALAERVQRSEAESTAARAELLQLRTQLDPHFLFNALNTVTAEIPDRPNVALEMTRRISDYMRYCLDHQDRLICRLADEIDAVRDYLRIQELRYDGLFSCTVKLEPEAGDFLVPHLILQGLVENAVKHSPRPATQALLQITVEARLSAGHLSIIVTNPGTYAPKSDGRSGLGLANIRRRLQLHYPAAHHIIVAQEKDLVCVRMTLHGPPSFA